jgi:hypothetical protein
MMTRVAALAAALAAALVAGSEAPAKVEGRLFGLLGTQSGQFVIEVDPATLQQLPRRRLRLAPAGPGAPWTLDPSGRTLAIARADRLQLVDLPTLRLVGSVKLSTVVTTFSSAVVWGRPDRIVVLRHSAERYEVSVVDVALRKIISRRDLPGGSIVDSERTPSEVVILRGPTSAIGPASLLLVGGGGETREIPLRRIVAGWHFDHEANPPSGKESSPGLTLDATHGVAYVVTPDGLVAEIALDREEVRYHVVHGRFAKLYSGWNRRAFFVGGKIVVTGRNSEVWTLADGKPAMRTDPAGLDVIDPATWQTHRLADSVSSVVPWGGGLLATGGNSSTEDRNQRGMGIALYNLDGSERFRLLDGRQIWVSEVLGDRAYVFVANEELLRVVDLNSGRVIGTRRGDPPWLLLEHNAPVW